MLAVKNLHEERQVAAATMIQCAYRRSKATRRLAKLKRKRKRRLRKLKRQKKLERKREKEEAAKRKAEEEAAAKGAFSQ